MQHRTTFPVFALALTVLAACAEPDGPDGADGTSGNSDGPASDDGSGTQGSDETGAVSESTQSESSGGPDLGGCGDGIIDDDEECDDGNRLDGDGCTAECVLAQCGDGIVHNGVEQCDDGNGDETDSCTNDCSLAACGDGIVQARVEECDDGNAVNGDGCDNSCVPSDKATLPAACHSVLDESAYCLIVDHPFDIRVLGVDSGDTCEVASFGVSVAEFMHPNLAWVGNALHACISPGGIARLRRVELPSGSGSEAPVSCWAAVEHQDGLLTKSSDPMSDALQWFQSWSHAKTGSVDTVYEVDPYASRFATSGDTLYAAWHSTNFLERWDLPSETQSEDLVLEAHDGWVRGMSVVGDRLYILTSDETIKHFDAASGALLDEVALLGTSTTPIGLACRPGV